MMNISRRFHRKIRKLPTGVALVLCLLSMAILPANLFAEGRVKPEWVMPRHYPHGFHEMGVIDRITDEQVVIDEQLMKLALSVEYNTPTEKNTSKEFFKPGKRVGYLLNSRNEIRSMWLIERE